VHLLAVLLVASVHHVLDLVHAAALPKTRTSENWWSLQTERWS
jgi:hypothetical protein